ncbi:MULTISPECIES: hypothetical protein [unclassified Thioalkalivibrio]|uniref:hypothetical protein n=1 Tax=unclassified Thioalkalivibrio TaxID=2621013 RepID=UPI00036432DD|nr:MULTISPECIES: hypothetical protein [unclassified Thioalkalivibrio]
MTVTRIAAAFLAAAVALSAGCATLTQSPTAAKIVTQQAVARWIGEDPGRAAETRRIVVEVRGHLDDRTTSLERLDQRVRDAIRWEDLDPADRLLLHDLLTALRAELVERFGERELSPHRRERLERVADWIEEAAARLEEDGRGI